jgi:hypothetical protein
MTASSKSGATVPIAQLVDGGQEDDALIDQLLRALGQLEDLHPRRDALLVPAQRLRGAPSSVSPRSSHARTALAAS